MQNNKLDIVIVADFCSNFDHKGNNRFIYLADILVKDGHSVEIVTSNFSHGYKKPFDSIVKEYGGTKVTMLQEKPYKRNVSIKRFFSHYGWGKRVGKYLKGRKKPDVVYCAMPTLYAAKKAGKYCKQNGVKFIIDIQDLWPEAYKMVFNVPILSSLLFAPFTMIANSAYKMADQVVAVSHTYVERALRVNKKVKKGHSVFLGTDLIQFDQNASEVEAVKKKDGEIWLGYYDAFCSSNDLKSIVDAMRIINNANLKLVVMGDIWCKKEYEDFFVGQNVLFIGKLPFKDACGVLSECDIVINPFLSDAIQSSAGTRAGYVAIGKPIINMKENGAYQSLVDKCGTGFNVFFGDVKCLTEKLNILIRDPSEREKMSINSRKFKEELQNKTHSAAIDLTYSARGELVMLSNGDSFYKSEGEFWVGYCGSLSDSYDIKLIIDAIALLKDPKIRFICMGDGYLKDDFESYGEQRKINQTFAGRLDYKSMCQLLTKVDIVVNPIRGKSAASIINKHADYAASGKPVINTQQSQEYIELINEYKFGYSFDSRQVKEISDSILYLANNPDILFSFGINSRRCAEALFNRSITYIEIVDLLSGICENGSRR